LSDLQTISGKDINSLDVNPAFISDDEVYINSPYLDGSGTAISGLVADIDGEVRNSPRILAQMNIHPHSHQSLVVLIKLAEHRRIIIL